MNSKLGMLEHGLVASAGHTEEEVIDNLFGLEIEGPAVLNEVEELLKVAFGKKGRFFLVEFLRKRSLLLLASGLWWKGRKSLALTRSALLKLRSWYLTRSSIKVA